MIDSPTPETDAGVVACAAATIVLAFAERKQHRAHAEDRQHLDGGRDVLYRRALTVPRTLITIMITISVAATTLFCTCDIGMNCVM